MKTRLAFTLVEILTVVVIIGILAAIVTVAVAAAMGAAKRARIATEMGHISMAIERYKAEIDEYPPDFYDDDAIVRHVKKRWPRFELPQGDNYTVAASLRRAMVFVYRNPNVYPPAVLTEWTGTSDTTNFTLSTPGTEVSSLAIWLGGFANPEGRFEGFSADPEAPFGRDAAGIINRGEVGIDLGTLRIGTPDKTKVFAELEVNKNVFFFNAGGNAPALCLGTRSGSTILPIIYFRGNLSGGPGAYYDFRNPQPQIKSYNFGANVSVTGKAPGSTWSECGNVVPYARSGTYNADLANSTVIWNNPTTYQLLHPGLDGKFGEEVGIRVINSGTGIGALDLDNITNFSDHKEIKSILP